jgi:hypothetical protein
MYQSVFISHSKDDPHLDFFHKVFSGLNTKAVWMEFEGIRPPAYQSIKNFVNASNALFVLLSSPLLDIEKRYTANWVSFEIGLAANWRSPFLIPRLLQDRIDVYVFEPLEDPIDFAVPYCTYYMPYTDSTEYLQFLRELIQNAPQHNKGEPVKCPYPNCQVEFKLLTKIENFVCPTCRRGIIQVHTRPA